jgi:hypothetical protein
MEKEEITPAAAEVAAGEVKNNITDIKIKRSGFYKHPGAMIKSCRKRATSGICSHL